MDERDLDEAVIDQVESILVDGPCALDDLAELLAEGGYLDHWPGDDFDELLEELRDLLDTDVRFWFAPGDVVASTPALLAGTVFTHRVRADEVERGMLDRLPDLTAIDADSGDGLGLATGGAIELTFAEVDDGAHEDGSYVGPDGWLDGFAPHDLLGVRRAGDDATVERVGTVDPGDLEVAALARAYATRVPLGDVGELLDTLLLDVLVAEPAAFTRPVRPVGELVVDAGLEVREEWVGPAGGEWEVPAVRDGDDELEVLVARYGLDTCCLEHLDQAMDAWNAMALPHAAAAVDWDETVRSLLHGMVAAAFADHVLPDDGPSPTLAAFAEALRDNSARGRGPSSFLVARNLDHGGEALAAETALQAAVHAEPGYVAALDELARYAADRGDVEGAVNLLRRSGVDAGDPELRFLQSMRPPRNVAGRNDPCPCGSGRKFKDCCLRNPTVSLDRRGDWLHHKLWSYALRPAHQQTTLGLAFVLSSSDDDVDDLLDLGLPMDLAVFEGGLGERFLAERGVLLPDDERALLAAWLAEPRALWEVVQHDGGRLRMRELASGRDVSVRTESEPMQRGEVVYARVGSIGDHERFVGVPIDIAPSARASVEDLVAAAPGAFEIAMWFHDVTEPGA